MSMFAGWKMPFGRLSGRSEHSVLPFLPARKHWNLRTNGALRSQSAMPS